MRRVLAVIGRALLRDLGVAAMWTGGIMEDVSMLWAINEWTRQPPETEADAWALSEPPAPSPERLVPDVPLSRNERVLWSDLLAEDGRESSARRLQPPREHR